MHALMLSDYTFSLRSHIRARSPDYPSLRTVDCWENSKIGVEYSFQC